MNAMGEFLNERKKEKVKGREGRGGKAEQFAQRQTV
jgi:hypothetical protein